MQFRFFFAGNVTDYKRLHADKQHINLWRESQMKQRNRTTFRPNRRLLSCALASCLAMAAPQVMAQSTGATLRGSASTDATITVTNVETGLTRSANAAKETTALIEGSIKKVEDGTEIANGTVMRKMICRRLRPSIIAASSISSGMVSK